jgi:hypothetical protein
MDIDYPKVRQLNVCLCGYQKDAGLVLCWPCHRTEKELTGGGYTDETIWVLNNLEAVIVTTMTLQ